MSVEYSIERFGPDILEAYSRLFPGDPDKSEDILRWRFLENPHGQAVFGVAREGRDIRGMIALVPTRLAGRNGERTGYQAIDTIVDPEFQGKFVFIRLGKLVEQHVADKEGILWGFPNAQAARGWFGRLEWARTGTVPFLIKPLRSGYFLSRLSSKLPRFDIPLVLKRVPATSPVIGLPEHYESQLWKPTAETVEYATDRSREWLKWRLAKPGANYRTYAPPNASAIVVTRTLEKHGGKIIYFMEALSAADKKSELAATILAQARKAANDGVDVALAWAALDCPSYASYRKAGFIPFPDRFRPVEIHHGYWPGPDPIQSGGSSSWYLSYLDSDTV